MPKKTTTYDLSPTLTKAGGRVSYWKLRRAAAKEYITMEDIASRQKSL